MDALISHVYAADIAFRCKEAELTGENLLAIKDLLLVKEVDAGVVYDDGKTRIGCERVAHGHGLGFSHEEWPCYGYRLVAENKTIAISGDTVDCEGLQALALNADILVLCCYLAKDEQQDFERETVSGFILVSSAEAGDIARKYHVKTLVRTHIRQKSDDMLKRMETDIRQAYSG